jgi:uncharacterized iron-regulated membrane protein
MTHKKRGLKKLYNLHAWVGFQLAFIMFIVLATGTIATLSNEIDWLIFPELRSSQKPEKAADVMQVDDWVGIYQSISTAYPNSPITSMTKLDSEYLTFRVVVKDDSLHNRFVQVDPWTYEVKGNIPRLTVQRFFRDFHRYLFMPAFPGLLIVGPLSILLFISLYTGIKTTKNWRKALWRVRVKQGKRILLSDLHKFLGLWGLWFTALMAITGAWYLYEFGNAVVGVRFESNPPVVQEKNADITGMLSVDEFRTIVTSAQNTHNDWEITAFYNSFSADQTMQFRGVSNSNPVIRNRAHRVFVDPHTHNIIGAWSPKTISTHAYINEYTDPLHFGDFGGFWLKIVWFVFGIALTAMSYTGVKMTWTRTKSSALTRTQKITLPVFILSLIAFVYWLLKFI